MADSEVARVLLEEVSILQQLIGVKLVTGCSVKRRMVNEDESVRERQPSHGEQLGLIARRQGE